MQSPELEDTHLTAATGERADEACGTAVAHTFHPTSYAHPQDALSYVLRPLPTHFGTLIFKKNLQVSIKRTTFVEQTTNVEHVLIKN